MSVVYFACGCVVYAALLHASEETKQHQLLQKVTKLYPGRHSSVYKTLTAHASRVVQLSTASALCFVSCIVSQGSFSQGLWVAGAFLATGVQLCFAVDIVNNGVLDASATLRARLPVFADVVASVLLLVTSDISNGSETRFLRLSTLTVMLRQTVHEGLVCHNVLYPRWSVLSAYANLLLTLVLRVFLFPVFMGCALYDVAVLVPRKCQARLQRSISSHESLSSIESFLCDTNGHGLCVFAVGVAAAILTLGNAMLLKTTFKNVVGAHKRAVDKDDVSVDVKCATTLRVVPGTAHNKNEADSKSSCSVDSSV